MVKYIEKHDDENKTVMAAYEAEKKKMKKKDDTELADNYCLRNGIKNIDLIFLITERAIQKQIKLVCEYLGYEEIRPHSSANGTPQRFTKTMVLILRLCSGFCSTAAPR